MAWNVNNITKDNKLIRETLQKADPDILALSETIETVNSIDHLGLADRTV